MPPNASPPPAAPPPPPPNHQASPHQASPNGARPGAAANAPAGAPAPGPGGDPSNPNGRATGPNAAAPGGLPAGTATAHNSSKPLDLEAILDAALPKPPAGGSHTGIDPAKVLEGLPEDAKKLVANLRDDYRKKTQSIADQRRELETRQGAWLAEQEASLREKMKVPDDIDIFSSEGLQKFIQAKVAEAMLQAQEPIRKANATEARKQELAAFRQAHPDLDQYRDRIVELVGKGMKPEDAYWRAKGEAADGFIAKKQKEIDDEKKKQAAQAAAGVRTTGLGSAVQPGSIQPARPKTAMEAYKAVMARRQGG